MKKSSIDLFRFATLRSPQLLSKERRELGFIEHPFPSSSYFLSEIDSSTTVDQARTILLGKLNDFNPIKNVEELKAISIDWWEFSLWLATNKNNLERSSLDGQIPENPLIPPMIARIWDTIYHDVLTERNPYVRQGCLQLIVAINFAENYTNYSPGTSTDAEIIAQENTDLARLANGKIVLHQGITKSKALTVGDSPRYVKHSSKKQEERHLANLAALQVEELKKHKKEFCSLGQKYANDYKAAYNAAFNAHNEAVEILVQDFLDAHPEIAASKEVEELIPINLIRTLKFSYPPVLSPAYYEGKLSPEAISYVNSDCFSTTDLDSLMNRIQQDIDENEEKKSKITQRKVSTLSINGVTVKPSRSGNKDFAISFVHFSLIPKDHVFVFVSLNTEYDNAQITHVNSMSLKVNNSDPVFYSEPRIQSSKNKNLFLRLSDTPITFPKDGMFEFEASLELNNGATYILKKKGSTNELIHSGLAVLDSVAGEDIQLYGINRIGVADYRKVEQELCCYIPGEVSHIENILAKEYKERATRNLTSTETTVESLTEREIEESTDTTSTTRHEMSSEIASVIERDRNTNTGLSAQTRGNILKQEITLNGYADFAFGQSSSNSNTQAQNYAEDVTRRALERIVQKTSVKRTSRILREFEENNKHGYDNRNGDKHVTGIFRWIDKVYKNRIVNYHKRLIYEFMIPEPARFYKDAIIIEAEESEVSVDSSTVNDAHVLIKPTHPSEHGILNPDSILRDNYKQFASLYNVNATSPAEDNLGVHGTYTESIGKGDSAHSFNSYTDIMIDPNYECYEIKGTVNMEYSSKTDARGYIRFSTGGKNWEIDDLRSAGNKTEYFTHGNLAISNSIKVSANTKKVISFTLSLAGKCRLKKSIFSQWQQDTYSTIMSAYEQQLQAYNAAQSIESAENSDVEQAENKTVQINPKFNAKVVNNELKRLCIEMLTAPFGRAQGKDFYGVGACEVPEIKLSSALDDYAAQVKFFEQAFDWEILSQMFYPYYWAKKCDWKALFQSQASDDPIFQAFLQSGMGRVIVPVREGFEDAVTFYMETGKIWNGTGLVVDTDDELYLSIVDEMTLIDNSTMEKSEWETVVPSTLTIVQDKSAKLTEEGLPCCEANPTSTLEGDTNILIRQEDTTASA